MPRLNIVIPMAGAGSRFTVAGYLDPKPLIKINGIEMIRIVINNIRPNLDHRFIFICQQSHIDTYNLKSKLTAWCPGCLVIGLSAITEGAACTVLAARDIIDTDDPLMVVNSDQYVNANIDDYLKRMEDSRLAGLIMTMKANDPKWSFVRLDHNNEVTEVVEKKVISDEATVGIYNFSNGRSFVFFSDSMIANNLRVNSEFYVAPVYNQMIASGLRVGIYNIGTETDGMYGLGTPSDLEFFKTTPICNKATTLL